MAKRRLSPRDIRVSLCSSNAWQGRGWMQAVATDERARSISCFIRLGQLYKLCNTQTSPLLPLTCLHLGHTSRLSG